MRSFRSNYRLFLLGAAASSAAFASNVFSTTGASQSFTVTTTGLYRIVAFGAQGGGDNSSPTFGGSGAEIGGFFNLTSGDVLTIDVGQAGVTPGGGGGGGGGGTFVLDGSTLLLVAGGGGGGGEIFSGGGGVTGTSGANGLASGANGGTSGAGGAAGAAGGSGGGYNSNGGGGSGGGGGSYPALTGGTGNSGGGGGYGGGGGGSSFGGGGGGGYSGGGGGGANGGGGGGGSFNFDTSIDAILIASERTGNGEVDLDLVTPEPASFVMLGLGLAAVVARAIGFCGLRLRTQRRQKSIPCATASASQFLGL